MNLLPTFSVPPARRQGYFGPPPPEPDSGQSFSEWLRDVYHRSRWWKWRGTRFRRAREALAYAVPARGACYFDGLSPCSSGDGFDNGLVVHHLHYDSLGNEADADLELVCRLHHQQLHDWAWGDRTFDHDGMDEFARTVLADVRVAQGAAEDDDIPF